MENKHIENKYVEKLLSPALLLILIVLSFLILQPIILSIIMGFVMAFTLNPLYEYVKNKTKSKNLAVIISCSVVILFITIPLIILIPEIVSQTANIYKDIKNLDISGVVKNIFPSLESSTSISTSTQNFLTKGIDSLINSLQGLVIQLPIMMLHFMIVFFTFVYVLREKDTIFYYLKYLLPFSKEIQNRFFKITHDVTASVIYGQFIIGIIQGLIVGLGLLISGVPNVLPLTIISMLTGVVPIIGPVLVWVPVFIYLIASADHSTLSAIIFLVFGLLSSTIDNVLRPMFVSRKTHLNTLLILIGMVGGFLFFGIIGLLLGPLIISYLLIVLDIYMGHKFHRLLGSSDKKQLNFLNKSRWKWN